MDYMVKKGVLAILNDGTMLYHNNNYELRNHDDILWRMLADNGILPDSYKRLSSYDDSFKHEISSIGKEAMVAASNGLLVTFLVYDNESNYSYAIIYLPEDYGEKQKNSFMEFLNNEIASNQLSVYFASTINKGLNYHEINDIDYTPKFVDEVMFTKYDELVSYLNNLNNNKSR